ncbi:MAG TPA: 4Fe-4S dicluster domain-containing protein [Chloroflexota bacterium]
MRVDDVTCTGCGECLPYCPVGAISLADGVAAANQDDCVECGVCTRVYSCPTGSMIQLSAEELGYPRGLRRYFSDPIAVSPITMGAGRGTEECKTNDRTGRVKRGQVGFGIELGRPGVSTSFVDVERVTMKAASIGVEFEQKNPIWPLIKDPTTGELKDEIKGERVLSLVVEFITDLAKTPQVIAALKEVEQEVDTVFTVAVMSRVNDDRSVPVLPYLERMGLTPRPNAKINVGLGRPLVND